MIVRIFLRLLEVSISISFIIFPLCLASRWLNRRYEPKWKYFIWLALAVRLMIPVNLPLINGISILPNLSEQTSVQTARNHIETDIPIEITGNTEDYAESITESRYDIGNVENIDTVPAANTNMAEIAAMVWCIGFCAFTVYQLCVYFIFRHEIFINGKMSEKNIIKAQIVEISDEIRLRRKITVIVNSKSRSPMMLGVIHPVLVIPREDYTCSEFNMIARHELTHCKRCDIWFKVLLTVVNAVHWFNPFVYLMVHEANADIELCCDADVMQNADYTRRKEYVDSIMTSMERIKASMPGSTCFSHGGIGKMKERFENIYNVGKKRTGIVLFAIIAIMSLLLGTLVSCSGEVRAEGQDSVSDSSVKLSVNILPIDESSGCELVNIEEIPDIPYPAEGDYLTLHEALYAFNYARSKYYAGIMALPEEERGESVYLEPYSDCKPSECAFFGNGVTCDEWKNNNHWHLPFHSTYEEFSKSAPRPAWAVIVKPTSEVADYAETIWIDAQTGDLYNDTNSGGYFSSPYLERSEYARILHDEEMNKTLSTTEKTTENYETTATNSTQKSVSDKDLVTIREYLPNIYIDLKYATDNNFTGQVIYDFSEPSLRYGTVKKLMKVQTELSNLGYSLKVWDAYRPTKAQRKLWEICPDPRYVSDPSKGYSGHCRGNTIDVTLVTINGNAIEMPSDYDEFSSLADRNYSDVSDIAAKNAEFLESVMKKHGFKGYSAEWWHYTDTVDYKVVE